MSASEINIVDLLAGSRIIVLSIRKSSQIILRVYADEP